MGENGSRQRGNAANTPTLPPPFNPYYALSLPVSASSNGASSISPSAPVDSSSPPSAQLCDAADFTDSSAADSATDSIGRYSSNRKSLLALSTCLTSLRCALIAEVITSSIANCSSTGIDL